LIASRTVTGLTVSLLGGGGKDHRSVEVTPDHHIFVSG